MQILWVSPKSASWVHFMKPEHRKCEQLGYQKQSEKEEFGTRENAKIQTE